MSQLGVFFVFLGRLHSFRGEERGSVGDFMPSVVWIGDRASSVVEKSVPLLDVTCLSVVSGS